MPDAVAYTSAIGCDDHGQFECELFHTPPHPGIPALLKGGSRRRTFVAGRPLYCAVLLLAAGIDVATERLPIRAFTTADGLPHNDIHRIVKDARGLLWFCTGDGLSRFDGYTFTNFGIEQGLPDSSVNDMLATRGGEYWVATQGGLAHFDPKGTPGSRVVASSDADARPMFTVVVPDDTDRRAKAITVLREGRDGTIWVGTQKGLYRLDRSQARASLRPVEIQLVNSYPEGRFIEDLLEDASGSLWIATAAGLYRRWPDGRSARYTKHDGLPGDYVHTLLRDHQGRLWAGTRYNGFFRFSADATRAAPVVDFSVTNRDGLPTNWVFQLFETSAHRFWAATAQGLVEFFPTEDHRGRRLHPYSRSNGLSYQEISSLSEDLAGNLWLGTNAAGAMKLTRDGFVTYGEQDGIQIVNGVFEDRAGDVCFRGTVLGAARTAFEVRQDALSGHRLAAHTRFGCFDDRLFDWFTPAAITGSIGWAQEHTTLQARTGEVWLGSGVGLYRFPAVDHFVQIKTGRPLALYTIKDGLAVLQVFRLLEDARGNIWISTTSPTSIGLARWDHESKTVRDMSRSPGLSSLKDDLPRAFGEDGAGDVWIGFSRAVARYKDGRFTFFTAKDGVPAGAIEDFYLDHAGRLWLASVQSGLGRIDDPGAERPTFRIYTTAEGLSSNSTSVVTEDRHGNIYVGGGRGLDRLDPATGRVKHFTTADGLAPGVFHAAFRDHAGLLWFGMSSGLARLAPAPDAPSAAPPVSIDGLRIRGLPQLVSALGEQDLSLPALTPLQNQLQIDFVGLSFGPGDVLRYQYRLTGTDTDWSVPSEQRSVTYASLSPGRYVFTVRAVNSDGIVSAHPATMSFTILRPLWQRAWFLALLGVATGLTAYGLYRYRLARLLEMAEMRTRIATDLHDDIGANLTRIALLSQFARVTGGDVRYSTTRMGDVLVEPETESSPLASIGRIARESVSSMNDIVWAINPARETLLDMTRRMRQHADEVFTQQNIELRFSAPDGREQLKLGVAVRRDVLLVFKEAVNNAARHSRCSRVEIDFRVNSANLELIVADNGSGFDVSLENEGQGLRSMARRARRLHGVLETESAPGLGTTVRLSIPL